MSLPTSKGYYRAEAAYAPLLREVGLPDALSVFEHPKVDCWRSITERENCVLDHAAGRLHVKRNKPGHRGVDDEVAGIRLLQRAGIPTVPLVAAGRLNDGRGFLITDDLAGYRDGEKLVQGGLPFETLLRPTADLAGRLHAAGLHHRDLYLCHFYARPPEYDLRLMDAGRVRPLPRWFRTRWLAKDVAQFVYSLRQNAVTESAIGGWLAAYAAAGGTVRRAAVERKVAAIGRHDASLRRRQPTRNVSIDR